jgi:2-polyprenyl-3-methyl-5-hydroxy-6-metoxy-1,4-benzoquinol methylase
MGSYYQSPDYISHTGGDQTLADSLYAFAREIMLRSKGRIVKKLTQQHAGTLLDIGAGTGHFVRWMMRQGWKADGVEVNENARRYALNVNNLELHASIEHGMFKSGSFDAVTLWHVLEHIHDTDEILKTIDSILKPDGVLFLAVPNCRSADALYYREHWAAYDTPRHLWHFDNNTLKRLALNHGYTCIKTTRMPFDSFYISILSEKNRNCRYPLATGLLRGLLFWVQSIIRIERSSSLLYAFKRNIP